MSKLPFPQLISLERWSAELLYVYKDERLPILVDEEKWQDWANTVAGTGIFKSNSVPSASMIKDSSLVDNFKEWEEWAKALYVIMINIKTT